jgi:hypothetical protein
MTWHYEETVSAAVKSRSRLVRNLAISISFCFALLVADLKSNYIVRLTGDAMDWRSRVLAGIGSIDCGRVEIRGDPSQATKCALEANTRSQSFRVIYNIQGIDESLAGGFVRTRHGAVFGLTFYGCPMGCGFSLWAQRVQVTPCPQPYHLYVNPNGRISCFQEQLSYPHDIMSPNAEPF